MIPLRNKSGSTVAEAFERLFLENGRAPTKLWTDKGTEFFNRDVDRILKVDGVTLYTTENEEKSCIVERWIRTFMNKLYTYFDTNRHTEYLKILPFLLEKYNNTKHRSIGCTPEEARDPDNYQKVFDTLYPVVKHPKDVLKSRKAAFSVGDKVRLSVSQGDTVPDPSDLNPTEKKLLVVDDWSSIKSRRLLYHSGSLRHPMAYF